MLFFVNIRAETVIRVDGLASTIEKLTESIQKPGFFLFGDGTQAQSVKSVAEGARATAQAAANSATVLATCLPQGLLLPLATWCRLVR